MMCGAAGPAAPRLCADFVGHVMLLSVPGRAGLREGYSPMVAVHAAHVPCRFEELTCRFDRRTGKVDEHRPPSLRCGDVALVRLRPLRPLCVERFAEAPTVGRFVVCDNRRIVAVGVVTDVRHVGDRLCNSLCSLYSSYARGAAG